MKLSASKSGLLLGLASLLLLALIVAPASPARAESEDVAMFYDALSPYGSWVDYGNYGPVWYPNQGVTQNWRPYMDGRWQPTAEGWVFETSEPWGWATYHWGNWMPTTEYGWVWSPGSTWYPSTAAWRTSDDYVGWAPIPPPDYVPEPAYYPTGGYYPGMPLLDTISSPFWIFAQAANFLLGFGQPYGPTYSYYNTGYLAPYDYVPYLFGNTLFLTDFYNPYYAPMGFYSYGPGFPFVSRVTNINITTINNYVRNVNFTQMHNVLPPNTVVNRHPFFRDAVPAAAWEGRGFKTTRAANPAAAERNLANPVAARPPASVPRLTKEIPKGVTPAAQPSVRRGERGAPGVAAPRGAAPTGVVEVAPRGRTAPSGVEAPRPGREAAPQAVTAPGREAPARAPAHEMRAPTRAPAHEVRTPAHPPTGEFRAPGRERAPAPTREPSPAVRAPREYRAPSRGTTMPPPATHELTPSMQRQIQQYHRAPSAPSAPAYRAPAPTYHAPAPAPHPSAPAPSGGGGGGQQQQHNR